MMIEKYWKGEKKFLKKMIRFKQRGCVSHLEVALPITLKSILKQKRRIIKTQNISPCKSIIFENSSRSNQNNLISVESTYVLQYLKNYQKNGY
jgi:hypothetical protein